MVKRLGRLQGIISGIGLRPVPKVLSSGSCRHRAHNVFNAILYYHRGPPSDSQRPIGGTVRTQIGNARFGRGGLWGVSFGVR
jgi:hypothetical protein